MAKGLFGGLKGVDAFGKVCLRLEAHDICCACYGVANL